MTVRAGVIGTGVMGADHVNTLQRYVPGAVVTAVADVDRARAEGVAAELPGVRASDDARTLIVKMKAALEAGACGAPRVGPRQPWRRLRPGRHERGQHLEGRRSATYPADWRPRFADAYRLQLQAWVDAVAAGRPAPLASATEGLAATAVAEAVIASMRAGGRPVAVEVPTPD